MVWLVVIELIVNQITAHGFQFHNGLISSRLQYSLMIRLTLFQFHNGLISRCSVSPLSNAPRQFQFHNGLISSQGSINVSFPESEISIPQWSD